MTDGEEKKKANARSCRVLATLCYFVTLSLRLEPRRGVGQIPCNPPAIPPRWGRAGEVLVP
eukprot:1172492-Prorocentrum_minimum.AAC.2